MTFEEIAFELENAKNQQDAEIMQRYFKTGKGEYAEGDIFYGIKSKPLKDIVKKYYSLEYVEINKLLNSEVHEFRTAGLSILVYQYSKTKDFKDKKKIVDFYLKNAKMNRINNWDLVDLSAYKIIGYWTVETNDNLLKELAMNENLWLKRIGIVSTFAHFKVGKSKIIYDIASKTILDKRDLIQKATGWMLREAGKKVSEKELIEFLKENHKLMGSVCFSYAKEKLDKSTVEMIKNS